MMSAETMATTNSLTPGVLWNGPGQKSTLDCMAKETPQKNHTASPIRSGDDAELDEI